MNKTGSAVAVATYSFVATASGHTHRCVVTGASTTRGHGPGASNDPEHPSGA